MEKLLAIYDDENMRRGVGNEGGEIWIQSSWHVMSCHAQHKHKRRYAEGKKERKIERKKATTKER